MVSILRDKWVLITGASSGFGAVEAARAFSEQVSKPLLGARRVERLEKVAANVKNADAAARLHFLDVSQKDSIEEFVAWTRKTITHGKSASERLHVLIKNAGGALGLVRMTWIALPLIPRNAGASIINVGS